MGSTGSPNHSHEDCVDSGLGTSKLFTHVHYVVAVRLLAGQQASVARSDQDSVRAAGVASSLIRNTGVKEVLPQKKNETNAGSEKTHNINHDKGDTLSRCRQRAPDALMLPNHIISNMETERHNIADRTVTKAISKSPWEQA
eukprot:1141990-Pelagomonas_calceolata.AAC.1